MQNSAFSNRTDRYIDCAFNSHSVPHLNISLCFSICIKQFARDKRATTIELHMFHKFSRCVALLQKSINLCRKMSTYRGQKLKNCLSNIPEVRGGFIMHGLQIFVTYSTTVMYTTRQFWANICRADKFFGSGRQV